MLRRRYALYFYLIYYIVVQKGVFSKTILIGSILWWVSLWLFTNNQVYATVIEDNWSNSNIISKTVQYWIWYARFIKWTCTDYAASRRPDIFPSRGWKDRLFGWDAIQWYHNARVAWLETGKTPEVGAIAVYARGRGASTIYGHVAIVEKVLDDETIEITDMNYLWKNIVTRRIVQSDLALWYIYVVKDSKNFDEKYSWQDNFNHNVADTTNLTSLQTWDVPVSWTHISYVINNNNQSDITDTLWSMKSSSDTQEASHQYRSDTILIVESSLQTPHTPEVLSSSVWIIQDGGYTHHSYDSVSMNNTIFSSSMMELSG